MMKVNELKDLLQVAIAKGATLEDAHNYIIELCYEFDVDIDIMDKTYIQLVERMYKTMTHQVVCKNQINVKVGA